MAFVSLITLLMLAQYLFFIARAGVARGASGIQAPAIAGDEMFERNLRVQLNTLEQLIITLPAMWVCAYFFAAGFAGVMGIAFIVGRYLYRTAYLEDPGSRGTGMMIGFVANVLLLVSGLWGVLGALL